MLDGEEQLVKAAVRGKASAFGALYDHYQPRIYRFVLVKVSHREEAEDLTHQVFLNAWQHIGTYQDFGFPFSSWLYRIARNQIIDHYRTRKQQLSLAELDPEGENPGTQRDDTRIVENRFELARIMAAIRTLKPEYQDVLLLRYVDDLSVKETAAAIGKTEGAVKVTQHRAVKELKQLLS